MLVKDTIHNSMELFFRAPKKPTMDLYNIENVIEDYRPAEKHPKEKKTPKP